MVIDASSAGLAPVEKERWQRVHDVFDRLRKRPRCEWHAALSAEVSDDPSMAYEVLSLLVANESIEGSQVQP